LEQFKKDLDAFLKNAAEQNYGGRGAPRVVLFSPIAAERNQDPNFPDPQAINTNLQSYTAAMAEVARPTMSSLSISSRLTKSLQRRGGHGPLAHGGWAALERGGRKNPRPGDV